MAQEHLKHADLHRSVAQRHGTTGGAHSEPFASITKSTHEGERSFKNARISHQRAALANSFMPAAHEHYEAVTAHGHAALLASDLSHEGTKNYHFEHNKRHSHFTVANAKLAVAQLNPISSSQRTADEAIKTSANHARLSKQIAYDSIHRSIAALPDAYWHAPAQ